ncbi:deoxynucleotide monophosphate kinase family protein [Agrobacterium tumefaciens]|uniref:deoxynucleotide monophosphate kinase family protein n=1 Tax=Agrobacterium tumefaciens TaxID=358 RepID=UPI002788AF65|nr:AAA family ATPase [Agrobacterium tumefaciens]MDP9854467.1 hypothetical protein [Agrobacterium tumefaciens]
MTNILDKLDELAEKNRAAYASAMADFRASFTLGETVASKDTGCLTAVPANDNVPEELRALGAAIGKANTAILPPVIALTGLAGSGKSTASKYLIEKHGYQLVKFAGPLKDMCRAVGMTEDEIEGSYKEVPLSYLCGKSPRQFMQLLGTQFGRDCIGKNFWTGLWIRAVGSILSEGGRVVVDDCRFPNEADEVRKLGGVVWRLVGRGGIAGSHESEAGCGRPDIEIHNTGEIADLHCQLDVCLKWRMEDAA